MICLLLDDRKLSHEYSTKTLKRGQNASIIAIVIAVSLAIMKGLVGFISGSTSLVSDALNSASDVIVMVASWIGLRIAQKKPTEKFPYGYYKVESLVTLGISIFIIFASITLIIDGISFLISYTAPVLTFPVLSSTVSLISSIAAALTAFYLIRVGRKINSQLLIASGRERIGDVITAISVFISIILSYYFFIPLIEGFVTIGISILILRMGVITAKDAIFSLMDISPSKSIEQKIETIVNNIDNIKSFENLRLRKAGPFIFGEITIKIKKNINVDKAHDISENLEKQIYDKFKEIESFTVHMEPVKLVNYKMVVPVKEREGLDSRISKHFGRARDYIILNIKKGEIIDFHSIKNPYIDKERRAGLSAIKMLLKKEPIDVLITNQMGEISYHTLHDQLIDIYKCTDNDITVKEIFKKFIDEELEYLKSPTKEKEPI
ncbi:MAG: cation diffusion facilitator family transporter [Candidatus Lokiarchaeota archaeon]|nr:cation diffusion facilitator family transporter [Candidatus Lokiarchaeota archaeon]